MTTEQWLQLASLGIGLLTAIIGLVVARQVRNVSVSVDGRLSQLLSLTEKSSHAEGMEQQRVDEVATREANQRTR